MHKIYKICQKIHFNQYTISEVGKGNRTNVHIEYATNIHVYIYINRMLNVLNVFKPE